MARILLTLLVGLVGTLPVVRAQDPVPYSNGESLSLTAGVLGLRSSNDQMLEVGIEYRLPEQDGFFNLRPVVGLAFYEEDNFFLHAGFRYEWKLSERWYLAPGAAVGGFRDTTVDLGSGINFRTSIELGYRIGDHSNLALSFYHLSNSSIADFNPGIESLTLSYSFDVDHWFGSPPPPKPRPRRGLLAQR